MKKTYIDKPNVAKFVKLTIITAAVVGTMGTAGYFITRESPQYKTWASELKVAMPKYNDKFANRMKDEKELIDKVYVDNKKKLVEMANYQEMLSVMGGENKNLIQNLSTQNENLRNTLNQKLALDKESLSELSMVSREPENKETRQKYLTENKMKLLSRWELAIDNNTPMYIAAFLPFKSEITLQIKALEESSQSIVGFVKAKLSDKSFNLKAGENSFISDVSSEIEQNEKDINLALAKDELTPDDARDLLAENQKTLVLARQKISSDKNSVEKILAKNNSTDNSLNSLGVLSNYSQGSPAPLMNTNPNISPNGNSQPVVINNNNSHMSFFDYYLLYHWMSAGSTVFSPSYSNSGYNARPLVVVGNQLPTKNAIGSKITPMVSSPTTNYGKINPVTESLFKKESLYSISNPQSKLQAHISEKLGATRVSSFSKANIATSTKPNGGFMSLKDKIASQKSTYTSKKIEISRIASAKASSTSSISRGISGSHGFSSSSGG